MRIFNIERIFYSRYLSISRIVTYSYIEFILCNLIIAYNDLIVASSALGSEMNL